jgi:hypothetical protein
VRFEAPAVAAAGASLYSDLLIRLDQRPLPLGLMVFKMSEQDISKSENDPHDGTLKPKRITLPHKRTFRSVHLSAKKRTFFASLSFFLIALAAFEFLFVPGL